MFQLIYVIQILIISCGIYTSNKYLVISAILMIIITRAWQLDRNELSRIQNLINNIDSNIHLDHIKKQELFKSLSLSQKLIYMTAFKAGIKHILKLIK